MKHRIRSYREHCKLRNVQLEMPQGIMVKKEHKPRSFDLHVANMWNI